MSRKPYIGKGAQALKLRQHGLEWKEIAVLLGYADRSGAQHAAAEAAKHVGLPAPNRTRESEAMGVRQPESEGITSYFRFAMCSCGDGQECDCTETGQLVPCTFLARHQGPGHRVTAIGPVVLEKLVLA